jgi:hypothetical protein
MRSFIDHAPLGRTKVGLGFHDPCRCAAVRQDLAQQPARNLNRGADVETAGQNLRLQKPL